MKRRSVSRSVLSVPRNMPDPRAKVIAVHPERVGGAPCFAGTRVPIKNLFDYLEGGESLDDFLEGFPGVTREQAVTVIHLAMGKLLEDLKGD